MAKGIFSLAFGLIFVSVSSLQRPLVCNNAPEPTFGEILHLLSPIDIENNEFFTTSTSTTNDETIKKNSKNPSFPDILLQVWKNIFIQLSKTFYSTKFPLAYLLSDGVFTVRDPEGQGEFFEDVVILKEKHWSQRYICQLTKELFPSQLTSLTSFCGCWSGVTLVQYYGERRAKDYLYSMTEDDWCVLSEPCQGQGRGHGQFPSSSCHINVDPLTTSCLASSIFSLNSQSIEQLVSYKLEVRTLKTQRWDEAISSAFLTLCHQIGDLEQSFRQPCYTAYDFLHIKLLPTICEWIPVYIVNALIAVIFLSIEDSVASHPLFRFLVAVLLGFFVAVIWAGLVLYRLCQKVFATDSIPLIGNLIQPGITAIFLSFSVLFTSTSIQKYILEQLLAFWSDGSFGIPWLGKAYFLLSITLSLVVVYRYGFFEEGTFSHTLLRLLLRSLGGIMMLLRCSPNMDICITLGIAALLRDHILDLSHYLWITVEASRQTPSYLYSGQQPLSTDDYSHQGHIHTTAALKELREYLQTPEGKAQAAKVSWKWREANRDDLSSKLEHFTKGLYSGRPSSGNDNDEDNDEEGDDEEEDDQEEEENEKKIKTTINKKKQSNNSSNKNSNKRTWFQTIFTLLVFSLVCLALSALVALVVFHVPTNGSESRTQSLLDKGRLLLEGFGILRRPEL